MNEGVSGESEGGWRKKRSEEERGSWGKEGRWRETKKRLYKTRGKTSNDLSP